MNILGNGQNAGKNYKVQAEPFFGQTVTKDEREYKDKSEEGKASKAMIKALNVLSFDHVAFVLPIANAPLAIRKRFVESIYILFQTWAKKYDNALWKDEDELDFLVQVKRVTDALEPYFDI